jgi:hypothetical protein
MFTLKIASSLVLCSKFFAASDRESVLAAIPEGTRRVVFIDTPATVELVATVEALKADGVEIHVRDHHDEPNPANPRAKQIAEAAQRIRDLVGGNAIISDRKANPACSSLIEVGQFRSTTVCLFCGSDPEVRNDFCNPRSQGAAESHGELVTEEGTVIVADPDPDGLLGAMKAAGVFYPELDSDADVLDGPHVAATAETLSPVAWLFKRAMSTLPPFDAARPQVSEDAKAKLFTDFVSVVNGDSEARVRLEKGVETYEAGVREAEKLAATVTDIMSGVSYVDLMTSPRFDLTTLAGKMEARPGTKVTVQKKAVGPIAAKCGGIQYSLAVAKNHQKEVNLQELLPGGFTSSPEAGIISNTTFLLHVSETVWNETVFPALKAKFGG